MSTDLIIEGQASEQSQLSERSLHREETSPMTLIERAVEKGMEVSQLKALVDLQEQMRKARAAELFSIAMNAVQAEMPVIVRDAENSHTRSRYARLDTITHQAKHIYTARGFALSFAEADSPHATMKRIICDVRHTAGHSVQYHLDLPIDGVGSQGGKSSMNAVQGCISTGSYGQRVLTCRIFNITIADTDLDGQAPNPSPNPSAPTTQPRGQRRQPEPTEPPAVSDMQRAHLAASWKARNPDPDGNLVRQRAALSTWLVEVAGRGPWKPANAYEWKMDDYLRGCRELGIDPEGIE